MTVDFKASLCHLSASVGHSSHRRLKSRWSHQFLFASLQHHKEPKYHHNGHTITKSKLFGYSSGHLNAQWFIII